MRFDGSHGGCERRHGGVMALGHFARAAMPHLTPIVQIAWPRSRGGLGFRHTPTPRKRVGVELRLGPRWALPAAASSRADLQHRLAEAALRHRRR